MITVDWANAVRLIVEVTIKQGHQYDLRKALADFLAATKDYRENCQITPINRDDEVATTVHDEEWAAVMSDILWATVDAKPEERMFKFEALLKDYLSQQRGKQ